MLSGEKKKYSPYLDTGLMDAVSKRATELDISVNEYITQALIASLENNHTKAMIKTWVRKLLTSSEVETFLTKELTKYVQLP